VMEAKTNGRLTKAYVDDGLDKQRVYSEDLFSRATKRVDTIVGEIVQRHCADVEKRLREALDKMRPAASSDVKPVEEVLPNANVRMLTSLNNTFMKLAADYTRATGLRVNSVAFIYRDGAAVCRAEVGANYPS
jgi:hypothetical protein